MKYWKWSALICSLQILLHAVPLTAFAEETPPIQEYYEAEKLYYTNHGDHIEITGVANSASSVCIPEEISGVPVTSVAEGAFAGKYFSELIWSPKIPVIPPNTFEDCIGMVNLVLPDTLEEIGAGAFDGCTRLWDVFYKGSDAQWDEVRVGENNAYFEDAYLFTNYNQQKIVNETFSLDEYGWSFTNNDLEAYLLTDETMTEYLTGCHPQTIKNFLELAANTYVSSDDYRGACAGFALTSYLAYQGILDPSDIYPGAETLHDIPMCKESIEAICYYFMLSYDVALIQDQIGNEADNAYYESGQFHADMASGKPVVLDYFTEKGAHSVIVYGIEYGEWQYNDTTYSTRLLTYDNNRLGFAEEACIYYNGDFDGMYIPYWESEAALSDFFYEPDRVLYGIGNRTVYQSTYDSGDLNKDDTVDAADAASILTAAAASGSGADTGLCNGQKSAADVNNDGVFDATDAAKVLEYAAYAGSGGELTFGEYLQCGGA